MYARSYDGENRNLMRYLPCAPARLVPCVIQFRLVAIASSCPSVQTSVSRRAHAMDARMPLSGSLSGPKVTARYEIFMARLTARESSVSRVRRQVQPAAAASRRCNPRRLIARLECAGNRLVARRRFGISTPSSLPTLPDYVKLERLWRSN